MYILFESSSGPISEANIYSVDCMGTAASEAEAIEWRNANLDYRAYKYVHVKSHINHSHGSINNQKEVAG